MPSKKRDYAEYSVDMSEILEAAKELNTSRFAAQYMKTGTIGYRDSVSGTYHLPSARTLVRLYILACKLREASFMNDIMKYILQHDLSFREVARSIWEWTADMCKDLGGQCTLRDYILDEVIHQVQEGNMSSDDVATRYPIEFQREFSKRSWLLSLGRYKLGFNRADGGYEYEFPASVSSKRGNSSLGISSSQLHNRVLKILKLKRSSSSATEGGPDTANSQRAALNDDEASVEIPSLRSSELRALEKYIEAFPEGYELIATSAERLLCGLDSISKSIAAMHPTIPCPSVNDLQEIVTSEEYQTAAGDFTLENETVNSNLFTADQLAMILLLWGERSATALQLGWLTDSGLPHVFPCLDEDAACVVWLHNDDAEAQSAGAFEIEFGEVLGHWSGLRPKSSCPSS